jgi:hypothetical protein
MTVGGGSPDDNIARFETAGLSMYSTKVIKTNNGNGQFELDYGGSAGTVLISTDAAAFGESYAMLTPDVLELQGLKLNINAVGSGSFGILALTSQSDITLLGVGTTGIGFGDFSADIAIADVSGFTKKNNSGYFCAPVMISSKGAQIGVGTNISVMISGEDNTLSDSVSRSAMIAGLGNTINSSSDKVVMIGGTANTTDAGLTNTIIIGGTSFNASLNDVIYHADHTVFVTEKVLKSSNGFGQIDLDFGGTPSAVLISTDNGGFGASQVYLEPAYLEASSYDPAGSILVNTLTGGLSLDEATVVAPNAILYSNRAIRAVAGYYSSGPYSVLNMGAPGYAGGPSQTLLECYHKISGWKATIDIKPNALVPVIDFSITNDLDLGAPHYILRLNGDTHYAELKHGIGSFSDNSPVIGTDARQLIDSIGNPVVEWTNASAQGVVYDTDYSATYVNRSLVDKEYVDTAVSGGSGTKYATTIAFTADVLQTVTHGLADTDIIVELRDLGTGEKIWGALVNNYLTNSVDITLAATTSVRVVIKK